jgi:putative phage-type endonuclease
MQEVKVAQRSSEWKEFRKGKIGASMAATILNLSPYRTALQAWEDLINEVEIKTTDSMQLGIDAEDFVLQKVNEELNTKFEPKVFQMKQHPNLIASLDGWDGIEHVEIKVVGHTTHEQARQGNVPDLYFPQCQHQCMVMGTPSAWYASARVERLGKDEFILNDLILLQIDRDEEFIKDMQAKELEFLSFLVNFQPPPAIDRDWIEINDPDLLQKVRKLKELNQDIVWIEERKEEIRKQLIFDHPRIKIGNTKVQRIVRRGNIQYDKIPELSGLDLEPYRKPPTTSVRIYE